MAPMDTSGEPLPLHLMAKRLTLSLPLGCCMMSLAKCFPSLLIGMFNAFFARGMPYAVIGKDQSAFHICL